MKKLFAILSAVAIFTGTLPVVMASGLDGLTTDEIIMDMGDANVVATFGGTDASAALATWTGTAVESDYAHNGTYYEYKPTTTTDDTTTISIVYTQQNLTAGDYEVLQMCRKAMPQVSKQLLPMAKQQMN